MNPSVNGFWKEMQARLKGLWKSVRGRRLSSLENEKPEKSSLALALGGGGLRGGAHVGVLSVLEAEGLIPCRLAGTSAGSAVAVLYAAGYTSDKMQRAMGDLKADLFTDLTMPRLQLLAAGISAMRDFMGTQRARRSRTPSGLIKGERFTKWLHSLLMDRDFEDLAIPTYVVATDLTTGEAVVFGPRNRPLELPPGYVYETGVRVVEAVRASCSIPFVFQPAYIHGRWLIDGAFSDPVPARVFSREPVDRVIAVDLTIPGENRKGQDPAQYNLFEVLSHSTSLITDRYCAEILPGSADLIIRPCAASAGLTEVEKIETFVRQGREAARQALQEWRQLSV